MRRDFRTVPVDHTRRSLKGSLLNGPDGLVESAADVAVDGEELERRPVGGFRRAGLPG